MAKPSEVMRKHLYGMLRKNEDLKEIFPLRQSKNIRRIFCRSRLAPVKSLDRLRRGTHKGAAGWKKCGKPCHICPFTLPNSSEIVGQANGYRHAITEPVNCETANWRDKQKI